MSQNIQQNTHDLILFEASKLFAQKGFESTSLADVAMHSGIKKASVYYFFASKDDLFANVLKSIFLALAIKIEKSERVMIMASPPARVQVFAKMLKEVINSSMIAGKAMGDLPTFCSGKGEHCKVIADAITRLQATLFRCLNLLKCRDPEAAQELITAAVQMYVIKAQVSKSKVSVKRFADFITFSIVK